MKDTIQDIYMRDHIKAFENAKSKGLDNPEDYMYMFSREQKDFFKHINLRNYINFGQ
jgi:hypothetical protein